MGILEVDHTWQIWTWSHTEKKLSWRPTYLYASVTDFFHKTEASVF